MSPQEGRGTPGLSPVPAVCKRGIFLGTSWGGNGRPWETRCFLKKHLKLLGVGQAHGWRKEAHVQSEGEGRLVGDKEIWGQQ